LIDQLGETTIRRSDADHEADEILGNVDAPMSNGRIFISYRRDDSAGYARAIYEQLVKRFAKDRVFMDVDSIEPGLPFDQVIKQAVDRCEILLAVIGKGWIEQKAGGGPRINDPKDFVRIEIVAALSGNVRVIPVLLDGASMPTEEALPEPLRPLALRNAIEVSNSRFSSDVERLVEVVSKILGESDTSHNLKAYRSRRPLLYWLLGGVAAAAIIPFTRVLIPWITNDSRSPEPVQADWRFCQKCQSMFFDGYPTKGVCPAGGAHSGQGFNFVLPHDVASSLGQPDWRFCQKCQSMFFDGYPTKGVCPAGGTHSAQGFNFVLPHDDASSLGQPDWRFCQKCQSMFFDGYPTKGVCAAGGTHSAQGFNFVLPHK
jgi:hypothetical protein